jgi:putative ABC transport system permease protein
MTQKKEEQIMGIIESLYGGMGQGLLWAMLAIGVYLTFRILDFPDLTAEGTLALGCAVTMKLINLGASPVVSTLAALIIGAAAGLCTGVLHTKLKIPAVLSGILTMIALYSINIRIMDGSTSLSIDAAHSMYSPLKNALIEGGVARSLASHTSIVLFGLAICAGAILLLYWFFGTELGASMRATGSNENMCRALGINTDFTKILTISISNAIIALAGALVSQQMSYGGTNVGVGSIVVGLAAIILGETFMGKKAPFFAKLILVTLGSVLYYSMITVIIYYGLLRPTDTKVLTALMVILAISLPTIKKKLMPESWKFTLPLASDDKTGQPGAPVIHIHPAKP